MGSELAGRGDLGSAEDWVTPGVAELEVVNGAFSYTGRHIAVLARYFRG